MLICSFIVTHCTCGAKLYIVCTCGGVALSSMLGAERLQRHMYVPLVSLACKHTNKIYLTRYKTMSTLRFWEFRSTCGAKLCVFLAKSRMGCVGYGCCGDLTMNFHYVQYLHTYVHGKGIFSAHGKATVWCLNLYEKFCRLFILCCIPNSKFVLNISLNMIQNLIF